MGDGLGLYMKDLYPNFSGIETSTKVMPDVNDQDALNEDVESSEKVRTEEASKKKIFLFIGLFIIFVVLLGMGG